MKLISMALCAMFLGFAAQSALAEETCDDFWYERNLVFKDHGYCFKTKKAIRRFGNAGCIYNDLSDVPLSTFYRELVQEIEERERTYGCKG